MVKFQLKKVLCMGVAIGNVVMEENFNSSFDSVVWFLSTKMNPFFVLRTLYSQGSKFGRSCKGAICGPLLDGSIIRKVAISLSVGLTWTARAVLLIMSLLGRRLFTPIKKQFHGLRCILWEISISVKEGKDDEEKGNICLDCMKRKETYVWTAKEILSLNSHLRLYPHLYPHRVCSNLEERI
ncbi:hypothetical protein GQ457_02G033700 [Hibiscus cannabinus]